MNNYLLFFILVVYGWFFYKINISDLLELDCIYYLYDINWVKFYWYMGSYIGVVIVWNRFCGKLINIYRVLYKIVGLM